MEKVVNPNIFNGGSMSTFPTPNVGVSLIRIHKVISRSLAVSIEHCQGAGPVPARQDGFQRYERALVSTLTAHHDGEEEIAFPFLKGKLPDGPYDLLVQQHQQITAFLERIKAWLEKGEGAWQPASLADLHAALIELDTLWHIHIPIEEGLMGPQAAANLLTPEENGQLEGQLAGHAAQHAQPSELTVPFVLYNLSGEDRAGMAATFPPVVTQQLLPSWKPAWAPMQPFFLD